MLDFDLEDSNIRKQVFSLTAGTTEEANYLGAAVWEALSQHRRAVSCPWLSFIIRLGVLSSQESVSESGWGVCTPQVVCCPGMTLYGWGPSFWNCTHLPPPGFPFSVSVMVNDMWLMAHPHWAIRVPRYLIKHYSEYFCEGVFEGDEHLNRDTE